MCGKNEIDSLGHRIELVEESDEPKHSPNRKQDTNLLHTINKTYTSFHNCNAFEIQIFLLAAILQAFSIIFPRFQSKTGSCMSVHAVVFRAFKSRRVVKPGITCIWSLYRRPGIALLVGAKRSSTKWLATFPEISKKTKFDIIGNMASNAYSSWIDRWFLTLESKRRISKVGPTLESHIRISLLVMPDMLIILASRKADFQDVVSKRSCDKSRDIDCNDTKVIVQVEVGKSSEAIAEGISQSLSLQTSGQWDMHRRMSPILGMYTNAGSQGCSPMTVTSLRLEQLHSVRTKSCAKIRCVPNERNCVMFFAVCRIVDIASALSQ